MGSDIDSIKEKFVNLVFDNMNIIYKICALYSYRDDEDLKQDIIFQLWKSYPTYKGNAKFQTWMYRVALNTALLNLRRKKLNYTQLHDDASSIPELDNNPMAEQIKLLYRHISKLNDIEKAVVLLYLEKFSYEEISHITGLSIKNVGVKLVRIKEKLRVMFNLNRSENE